MDSPGHSSTAASADRSPFGGSDPDDDPVVHEPRSLFGALDGLGARRASAADPGAFWDKTFTGVSGAPVGGVGGVAHDAAAEHSALLGSSLGDGEGWRCTSRTARGAPSGEERIWSAGAPARLRAGRRTRGRRVHASFTLPRPRRRVPS